MQLIMKKEYIAPESKIIEVSAEGQLCASGEKFTTNSFEQWYEDEFVW